MLFSISAESTSFSLLATQSVLVSPLCCMAYLFTPEAESANYPDRGLSKLTGQGTVGRVNCPSGTGDETVGRVNYPLATG